MQSSDSRFYLIFDAIQYKLNNNYFMGISSDIVRSLTTEKKKIDQTLDLVIFSLDIGYGNLIMSYLLFVKMII